MSTFYHPKYLRQRMQALKYRYGGTTMDPNSPGLYQPWFDDPMEFVKYIGDRPKPDSVLIHFDKSKWYGPGNVKWGSKKKAMSLRVDSPKWASYYEDRPLPQPKSTRPEPTRVEGKTLWDWTRESGVSLYMIQKVRRDNPRASMEVVLSIARGQKLDPKWSAGRPAQSYEGKTVAEWSRETGIPEYYIRQQIKAHLDTAPMERIVKIARERWMRTKRGGS